MTPLWMIRKTGMYVNASNKYVPLKIVYRSGWAIHAFLGISTQVVWHFCTSSSTQIVVCVCTQDECIICLAHERCNFLTSIYRKSKYVVQRMCHPDSALEFSSCCRCQAPLLDITATIGVLGTTEWRWCGNFSVSVFRCRHSTLVLTSKYTLIPLRFVHTECGLPQQPVLSWSLLPSTAQLGHRQWSTAAHIKQMNMLFHFRS